MSGFTFSVHLASITIGSTLLHGGDPGFPDMRLVWRGIPASGHDLSFSFWGVVISSGFWDASRCSFGPPAFGADAAIPSHLGHISELDEHDGQFCMLGFQLGLYGDCGWLLEYACGESVVAYAIVG